MYGYGWYGARFGRGMGRGHGGWDGQWPDRGPFSHLPPWQRPGWLYGRGACRWLFNPYLRGTPGYGYPPPIPTIGMPEEQEKQILEDEAAALEERLEEIRRRLTELKK